MTESLLQLKGELLCLGIRSNQHSSAAAALQNPATVTRTGHVGLQFMIEPSCYVNAPVLLPGTLGGFTERSPFELWRDGSEWALRARGEVRCAVELVRPPSWYVRRTSSGVLMSEIFLFEGERNLMGSIPGSCFYMDSGLQCRYCRFESNGRATPRDYADTVCAAIAENPDVTVTLTGGAAREARDSILRFVPYVRSVSRAAGGAVPIEIECPPPPEPSLLGVLVEAGASSFSINLDLFDEGVRRLFCPGKSQLQRDDYMGAWEWIVENIGPYKAASVLIFGLEQEESTRAGVTDLLQRRVRPNVLPFKPMTGSPMADCEPTDPRLFVAAVRGIAAELLRASVPTERIGCSTCSACSLEADVLGGLS